MPVTMAVRPVRPPAPTPVVDSRKLVTVEVPRQAPAVVPMASAMKTRPAFGSLPFSSNSFAFSATPMTVPTVSKRSRKRKLKTMAIKRKICSPAHEKLNLKAVSPRPEKLNAFVKSGIRE